LTVPPSGGWKACATQRSFSSLRMEFGHIEGAEVPLQSPFSRRFVATFVGSDIFRLRLRQRLRPRCKTSTFATAFSYGHGQGGFKKRGKRSADGLVSRSRIGRAFAAMDFRFKRGVSDEHTLQGSGRSEQRSLNRKDMPPSGLRRSWLLASLLLSHSPTSGMLLRRASPEANCGATNAHPIREWDTSPRELDLKPGTRGHGCPRSNLKSALVSRMKGLDNRSTTCPLGVSSALS